MADVPAVPPTGPIATPDPQSVETVQLRTLTSLLSRAVLAQALGQTTFGGKRNVDVALGYKSSLTVADYRWRYARNAVAARVMEAFPKATWRGGAEIIEDEDPDIMTDFETEIEALAGRLQIWPTFLRADLLAGLGRYSGILIGAKGDLDTKLPKMRGQEDVLYLSPYAEDELLIAEFDDDPASRRFGLPEIYQLQRSSAVLAATATTANPNRPRPYETRQIHWTRIIHFADAILDDRVFGTPRLERVWNLLDDLEKVTGGGAEAFWQRAHQGLQFNIEKDVVVTKEELADLKEQVDEYQHGMRRALRTRGVDVNMLGSDTAEFGGAAEAVLVQIASGSGVPRRILTGSEAGELASTQDRSNWNDRVQDRRKDTAEPLVRAFLDRLSDVGGLPIPDDVYDVRWPRQEELTEMEKTSAIAQLASANAQMITAMGAPVMSAEEIRDRYLHLGPLEIDLARMPGVQPDERSQEFDDAPSDDGGPQDSGPKPKAQKKPFSVKVEIPRDAEQYVAAAESSQARVRRYAVQTMKRSLRALDSEALGRALAERDHPKAVQIVAEALETGRR